MWNTIRQNSIGNLALEVLSGCNRRCSGCQVDREGPLTLYTEEDLDRLNKLVEELREAKWDLSWIEIAPVDVMVAKNRKEILTHPKIKSLLPGFSSVVLNCSFLSPKEEDYVEFAKELDDFADGLSLEFLVPVEFRHYENIAYIERIKSNIRFLDSCLTKTSISNVTATVNSTEELLTSGLVNEKTLHETRHIELYPKSDTTTFVFHHGRGGFADKKNKESFRRTIILQNKMFAEHANKELPFKIDEVEPLVGADYHLAYRDGQLYMSPFINSPIACFDEEYMIKTEWSVDGLYIHDNLKYIENLERAMNTFKCSQCKWLTRCAMRGVHSVNHLLETKECLSVLSELTISIKE